MKYSNIKYFCTTNGDGFRIALFVSGCNFHCKGCFNQNAWDFDFGKELTDEVIDKILTELDAEYYDGLSILGGEPLDPKNVDGVKHVVDKFREKFGNEKDIWIWSGYTKENFNDKQKSVVELCDYIVDGPFELDNAKQHYRFKGSSNQRIWQNKDGEFNIIG